MATVRSLGVFLPHPLDVPRQVLEYLADQLKIADASCAKQPRRAPNDTLRACAKIKDGYGLKDFAEVERDLERLLATTPEP